MPGAHPYSSDAQFVRRVLIVLAIGAAAAAVWLLSDILLLLFGSVLVAVILRAIADPLARGLGLGDRLALALGGLLVIALIAACVLVLGPEVVRQMRGLLEGLPTAFAKVSEQFQLGAFSDVLKDGATPSSLGNLITRIVAWSSTVVGALASLLLVIFGGIYIALAPDSYRKGLVMLVPPAAQPSANAALDEMGTSLRQWLGGQVVAMLLVGVLTAAGLWLVGVPSAFALGMIAGLAEFVPVLGPIAAAVPILLIAAAVDLEMVLWALGVVVLVQQLEGNLITPLIANRTVSIAPAVGLFALVAMGVVFGPLGLLFGFPLTIVLDVAMRRFYVREALGERVEILGKTAGPT